MHGVHFFDQTCAFDEIFYSVDFREMKEGSHWSATHILGSRAYFNVRESILSIERVEEADAGKYKCRIDFEKSPTINYVVDLRVIGKCKFIRIQFAKQNGTHNYDEMIKIRINEKFQQIISLVEFKRFNTFLQYQTLF